MKSITEEAKIENIAVITDFVNSILEANGCSAKVQMEIDIAIDEIFGNIAYYAYTPKTGEATVQVEIKNFPERLELTFIDKGIPYNPLENKDPDVTLDIEKRKIGGFLRINAACKIIQGDLKDVLANFLRVFSVIC